MVMETRNIDQHTKKKETRKMYKIKLKYYYNGNQNVAGYTERIKLAMSNCKTLL